MSFYVDRNVLSCASQARLLYGQDAIARVAQQVEWAGERGNPREILYWTSVLDALIVQANPKLGAAAPMAPGVSLSNGRSSAPISGA